MGKKGPRGLAIMYANDLATRRAFVSLLVVRPRSFRLGIGTKLIRSCLRHAKEKGMISIWLKSAPDNRRARRLYENAGFRATGRWKRKVVFERFLMGKTR
jgi:ribosomal protein S18 acetylase RimI-like enzyme